MAFIYKINIYESDWSDMIGFYIGQTKRTVEERIKEHLRDRRPSDVEVLMHMYPFNYDTLIECPNIEIVRNERKYIRLYMANCHRYPNTKGLNTTDGGETDIIGACAECERELTHRDVHNDGGYHILCPNPECPNILSLSRYVHKPIVYRQVRDGKYIVSSFDYRMLLSSNNIDRQQYLDNIFNPYYEMDRIYQNR